MSGAGIAVTGVGLALPLGCSVEEVWDRTLRSAPADATSGRLSVPPFDAAIWLRQPKNQKFMSPCVKLLLKSAKEACDSARLVPSEYSGGERVAAYVASGRVGPEPHEFFRAFGVACDENGDADYSLLGGRAARLIDPYFPLRTLANSGLALLAIEFGIHGPTNNFGQTDVAGVLAVDEAIRDLREHRCDVAVVGAYDSLTAASTYLTFSNAGLLSESGSLADCRPFDRESTGMVLGEGAGTIVLERTEDAIARSANILAEIGAWGTMYDTGAAFWPDADPMGGKLTDQIQTDSAVRDAVRSMTGEMRPDFLIASGVGVPARDRSEAVWLSAALDPAVPVTALKGVTGYLGAATAIVETVLAIQALRTHSLPPVAGLCTPWPEATLAFVRSRPAAMPDASSGMVVARSWTGEWACIRVHSC
jgi:3-oxoacyl-[acyl-carrier-protein] synthase II